MKVLSCKRVKDKFVFEKSGVHLALSLPQVKAMRLICEKILDDHLPKTTEFKDGEVKK